MLIPLKEIIQKYNLNIKGVIQVGAHWAEEHDIYMQLGIKNIVYIEPCKRAFKIMAEKLTPCLEYHQNAYFNYTKTFDNDIDNYISTSFLNYACGENDGVVSMYVSHNNQGQSNSLLKPNLHLRQHPEVVFNDTENVLIKPLDKLMNEYIFYITPIEKRGEKFNLLVMDVQGAEGLVLKGATETLKHIDCIYTEINRGQTYEGNMEIQEMDNFLWFYDFVRVETQWASENLSWGDSVYLKQQNQA